MKKSELLDIYADTIDQMVRQKHTYAEISDVLYSETGIRVGPTQISKFLTSRKKRQKYSAHPAVSQKTENADTITFYKNGTAFCYLTRTESGIYHFSYDEKYRGEKEFAGGIYDKIPPFLENLLPEGANLRQLERSVGTKEKFILLQHLEDSFGAITTTPVTKQVPDFSYNPGCYKETFLSVEEIRLDIPKKIIDAKRLDSPFSGETKLSKLSGAQPKLSVVFTGSELRLQEKFEYSNAIMKVDNLKFRDLNLVENMLLSMARFELGFEVAETFIIVDPQKEKGFLAGDPLSHLVTRRFDRSPPNRVYEAYELASLMELESEQKYSASMEEIFDFLETKLRPKDMRNIARQFAFSYLVGNGDLHVKNIALFKEAKRFSPTPVYDVVNTKIYPSLEKEDLAASLKNKTSISPEEIFGFLGGYLSRGEIHEMAKTVNGNYEEYLNATPFDTQTAKRLEAFFANRMSTLQKASIF